MQYSSLIASIEAAIYTNNYELITGDGLQTVLKSLVSALANAGATYKGAITPASALVTSEQACFFLATQSGTYTNYVDSSNNPVVVTEPSLIVYDGGASYVFTVVPLGAGGGGGADATGYSSIKYLTIDASYGNDPFSALIYVTDGGTNRSELWAYVYDGYAAGVPVKLTNSTDDSVKWHWDKGDDSDGNPVCELSYGSGVSYDAYVVVFANDGPAALNLIYGNASSSIVGAPSAIGLDLASGSVRYDQVQSLTAAEQLQARTNIGAAADTKVFDQTLTLERLQPTSYDSGTGYYSVDSFPSWVTATDGGTFAAALNVVDFTAANTVPFPSGNTYNVITLTKIDSTHFTIPSGDAPSGTPNCAAFFFTKPGQIVGIPCIQGAKTRYLLKITNGGTMPSRYDAFSINASSADYPQGPVFPTGASAFGYDAARYLQTTIEFEVSLDYTTATPKITAHSIKCGGISKSSATAFTATERPVAYGDKTINLWGGSSSDTYFYIHNSTASRNWAHDGTRIEAYIIG